MYRSALKQDLRFGEAYYRLGLTDLNSADMLKNATELADKLVDKDPRSFEGHRLLGQIDLIKRNIPTAVKELAAAPIPFSRTPCFLTCKHLLRIISSWRRKSWHIS
jgi:hypothetical protein